MVGSRGDVQPFVALGIVLKEKYGHRVRLATHPTFRSFVEENGLEFFSIGGDPAELMAFMVKNPGLMPGIDSLRAGDVGKRRKDMYEIVQGCWRSCIEIGDGTGIRASDDNMGSRSSIDSGIVMDGDSSVRPFVADAIIANPPSFAHIHCAEKLGIPLHLMFTLVLRSKGVGKDGYDINSVTACHTHPPRRSRILWQIFNHQTQMQASRISFPMRSSR